MEHCKRRTVIGTTILLSILSAIGVSYMSSPKQDSELVTDFKNAIKSRYVRLVRQHLLDTTGVGDDITTEVMQFIHPGTNFNEAESILADAGFRVSPRPGRSIGGNRTDRFDVFGVSDTLIPSSKSWVGTKVLIDLQPNSPKDYSTVSVVRAFLVTTAL